jgi:hypothetical protein
MAKSTLNTQVLKYVGCSKRFGPHYFSQSLTKIEECGFEGFEI